MFEGLGICTGHELHITPGTNPVVHSIRMRGDPVVRSDVMFVDHHLAWTTAMKIPQAVEQSKIRNFPRSTQSLTRSEREAPWMTVRQSLHSHCPSWISTKEWESAARRLSSGVCSVIICGADARSCLPRKSGRSRLYETTSFQWLRSVSHPRRREGIYDNGNNGNSCIRFLWILRIHTARESRYFVESSQIMCLSSEPFFAGIDQSVFLCCRDNSVF